METNSQHSIIIAIFATDTSNPWSWRMVFDSTATKQIYKARDATFQRNLRELPTRIG